MKSGEPEQFDFKARIREQHARTSSIHGGSAGRSGQAMGFRSRLGVRLRSAEAGVAANPEAGAMIAIWIPQRIMRPPHHLPFPVSGV